jgi:hypothetical protein
MAVGKFWGRVGRPIFRLIAALLPLKTIFMHTPTQRAERSKLSHVTVPIEYLTLLRVSGSRAGRSPDMVIERGGAEAWSLLAPERKTKSNFVARLES